ncbi:hypothetical protein ILUMI_14911 [Ignelater luminosus]|uniref:Uncharacterized protein n=1 Tax=Ignelater luminosus TaxID=2038154 RepID=A0A8K0CVP5_IGNLU|nr:hypothetical protein ILUMI_14911 [Ignelater luminosus]
MYEEKHQMKKQIVVLQTRVEFLEKDRKKRNLFIRGVNIKEIEGKQLKGELETFLEKGLDVKVKLTNAKKLGVQKYIIQTERQREEGPNKGAPNESKKLMAVNLKANPNKTTVARKQDNNRNGVKAESKNEIDWTFGIWNIRGLNGKEDELTIEFEKTKMHSNYLDLIDTWELVNERIMSVQGILDGKQMVAIIIAYDPNESDSKRVKDDF